MSFYSRFGGLNPFKGKKVYQLVGDKSYDRAIIDLVSNQSFTYVRVPVGWDGRPDLVANAVYGNPELWPDILAANAILDPFELKGNSILKIPRR